MNQQFRLVRPIIDMQKAAIEGMINSMILLWEQSATFFGSAMWLPEEGRDTFRQWVDINKEAFEDWKKAVDRGYSSLESGFERTAQHMQQRMKQVRENLDQQRQEKEHREAA